VWAPLCIVVLAIAVPIQWAQAQPQSLPDLTPDSQVGFTFLGRNEQGKCLGKLRITVKNKGDAKAGSFVVAFTISQVFYSVDVSQLAENASVTVAPDVTIPVGTNLVRVLVDATGAVVESNEVNNSVVGFATCAAQAR
jgi:subtilase family serine protease